MARYISIYGALSGLIGIALIMLSMTVHSHDGFTGSVWFGFLLMLLALSFVFVGVKRYRDVECGGVVRFWRALALALGIAGVAGIAYVLTWEVYLALTHYAFIDNYTAGILREKQAHGVSGAALAQARAEMAQMKGIYANPLSRMGMTFVEMLPVSIPVALFSAASLRFPRFLPAKR